MTGTNQTIYEWNDMDILVDYTIISFDKIKIHAFYRKLKCGEYMEVSPIQFDIEEVTRFIYEVECSYYDEILGAANVYKN